MASRYLTARKVARAQHPQELIRRVNRYYLSLDTMYIRAFSIKLTIDKESKKVRKKTSEHYRFTYDRRSSYQLGLIESTHAEPSISMV